MKASKARIATAWIHRLRFQNPSSSTSGCCVSLIMFDLQTLQLDTTWTSLGYTFPMTRHPFLPYYDKSIFVEFAPWRCLVVRMCPCLIRWEPWESTISISCWGTICSNLGSMAVWDTWQHVDVFERSDGNHEHCSRLWYFYDHIFLPMFRNWFAFSRCSLLVPSLWMNCAFSRLPHVWKTSKSALFHIGESTHLSTRLRIHRWTTRLGCPTGSALSLATLGSASWHRPAAGARTDGCAKRWRACLDGKQVMMVMVLHVEKYVI